MKELLLKMQAHNSGKKGQAFSLIHLVELVLGLLVIALIGLGIMGMICGIKYYQEFYSKDNAYLIEALHSVPNGDVDYGYLWSTPGYEMEVETGKVTVNKSLGEIGNKIRGPGIAKAYGTGIGAKIIDAALIPRYLYYKSYGTPIRTISVTAGVIAETCPAAPPITSIGKASYGFPSIDTVGESMANNIIDSANNKLGLSGQSNVKLLVLYEPTSQPEIIIYDTVNSAITIRLSCLLEAQHREGELSSTRSLLSVAPAAVQKISADIIIIARGQPKDVNLIEKNIANALGKYLEITQPATGGTN